LDESGDLGFDFTKLNTSNFFIITFLFTTASKPIEKCVNKTHRMLREKYKKIPSVLHCYQEENYTRTYMLKLISQKDCHIMSIILNKKKVYTTLTDEKTILYNYVTNILIDRIYNKNLIPIDMPITLIASKKETNKFLNFNFKNYLERQNTNKLKLNVGIKTPSQEKGLQAVDFISWAIFRKYEKNGSKYYDIIKNNISEENPLFP